jgi:ApaG protein|tara:strand:- start:167 stop:553 length:387 start_codon:yes stop_codon:yes gene_type:complete
VPAGLQKLPGLRVEVEEVIFMPHLDAPDDRPYPFVYFISIINDSSETVAIRARKWILRDLQGELVVIEGRGVVGEMPELQAGERFSYNSYHVIASNSEARGSFFGLNAKGEGIRVSIPPFNLVVPKDS